MEIPLFNNTSKKLIQTNVFIAIVELSYGKTFSSWSFVKLSN